MIDQYLKDCEERANLPVSMGYGLTNYNRDVTKLTKMLRKAVEALECSRDMRKHFIASNTTDLEICQRFDKAIEELDDES